MFAFSDAEVWLVPGSQHLYGPATLEQVATDATMIAQALDAAPAIPVRVVCTPVMTEANAIRQLCLEANRDPRCLGLITWMHTFSPAKMWIGGLSLLQKPLAHLHTQVHREIPWSTIDMDFMNLHQSAHGDREFGFLTSRLHLDPTIIVGSWQDDAVQHRLGTWVRAAAAWADWQGGRVVRFGDNMRDVAVTEGDKVEAERQLGYGVQGYGVGDLVQVITAVEEAEVDALVQHYQEQYVVASTAQAGGSQHERVRQAARQEIGIRRFLEQTGAMAWTTTFEDLHGLDQLPGLAAQRLMAEGYGYGAEGDWKTAALVRAMLVMGQGLPGGTSFMEDYTYHLDPERPLILGAHMLEISEQIASEQPSLEVHPLSIGGKADPARLVFAAPAGPAVVASLVDVGDRFRLIVNAVEAVTIGQPMPKLPVARALWHPLPDFATATTAWLLAGGAHHTGYSSAVTAEMLEDFARIAGIEVVIIDTHTQVPAVRQTLRWNDLVYSFVRR